MSGYKLSLNSVRSINRTIVAVNQMRKTGIAGDLPFRQNAKRQTKGGATLQIGKTTEEWMKGTEAAINVYKEDRTPDTKADGSQKTAEVFNHADVEADKWVAWMDGYLAAGVMAIEGP